MGGAILAVLPFAPGLLLSPLPPVAASVLTMADDGRRRALLFTLCWWCTVLAGCLAAGLALRLATPGVRLPEHTDRLVCALLGTALVAVALVRGYGFVGHRYRTAWRAPAWLPRVAALPTNRAGPFAVRVLCTDPLHLLILAAAAVALAATPGGWPTQLAAAALLAVVGTLGVAIPLIVSYAAGWSGSVRLHALRRTPIRAYHPVGFWVSVGYAAFLLT
ncbi:hypothetical protein Athai_37250 [Actinocatenispora thailandica]|uniref:GAP family protein n=1 Tax=Actinocatenispora thailandica TaxID=227318 RepID=A0A7R7DR41_9ACTN|nr:GAP family protein [Actinocatenispora thailandica]BCJ36222.1 hypothetical protein Athai_37250 [Actinocatenispora thailandica]